ncbi:MAG: phosphinothricin acetyltransferase [Cellvibrionaceae bacterium]|jgi:phosphinothricin acetyltransferase
MTFITCTYTSHAQEVLDILNQAIVSSTALYDYKPRKIETMVGWFKQKDIGGFPVIGVTNDAGQLMGFATYGTFRAWPAYKYSVEHSVYIHIDHRGKGLGRLLMQQLIISARRQQYHTMIGGIDISNIASISLHEKLGFTHAGTIKQAAYKFDRWLDLGFYQLLLDSPKNPIDG